MDELGSKAWLDHLEAWLAPFLAALPRAEQRRWAPLYLRGPLLARRAQERGTDVSARCSRQRAATAPLRIRLALTTPLLRALLAEVLAMPVLYDELGREGRLVDLLLAEIGRMPASSLHVAVPQDDRLGRICESVLSRAGEIRTLDEWALLTGLSRRTITRLFRRETGMSFSAWQQRVRLMEALARLGGGASVTSVALDVGYDSPSAFTAMFKRVLGTCPRTYLDWA